MAASGHRQRQNSEPSSAVVINSPDHAARILSQLSAMRTDRASTDTVLVAGETEVMCHRAVLAASSPYFHAMFHSTLRESREQRIKLDGVTALSLNQLVDYIYTGRIEVRTELQGRCAVLHTASIWHFIMADCWPIGCKHITSTDNNEY